MKQLKKHPKETILTVWFTPSLTLSKETILTVWFTPSLKRDNTDPLTQTLKKKTMLTVCLYGLPPHSNSQKDSADGMVYPLTQTLKRKLQQKTFPQNCTGVQQST